MNRYLLFLLNMLCLEVVFAQQISISQYLIYFSDKNNSSYSVSMPGAYLSQKALERRYQQGIDITTSDLPLNQAYLRQVKEAGNVTLLNRSKWLNLISISTGDMDAIETIQNFSFVEAVVKVEEGSFKYIEDKFREEEKTSAPVKSKKTAAEIDYGEADRQVTMIGCEFLHNSGYRGSGKTIAVLDAGFQGADTLAAFAHLRDNGLVLGTRDFVAGGTDVYHTHGHGTNVLSVMAAYLPGKMVGTAPFSNYWLFRTEDVSSETIVEELNWVAAAEFADSVGADIINSSLGYVTFNNPNNDHTYEDMDGNTTIVTRGADMAASKGILVVNSMGNWGGTSWQYMGAPADGDSVMSIGAVDKFGEYAVFSSVGPTFDGRIKPTVTAMGQATTVINPDGTIRAGSGTSFSSPVIAGAAASLWSSNHSAGNMEVYEAIKKSAHQYFCPDTLLGYGIPDFKVAYEILDQKLDFRNHGDSLAFYPNPFFDSGSLVYYTAEDQEIFVEVFDMKGSLIARFQNEVHCGPTSIPIESKVSLGKGAYILRVKNTKASVWIRKIIKL